MRVEIVVPDNYAGDVIGDASARRGRIEGMEQVAGLREVYAVAPLAEMFGYASDLRSRTQGRASHSMEFSQYEPCPSSIANEIMERSGASFRFS